MRQRRRSTANLIAAAVAGILVVSGCGGRDAEDRDPNIVTTEPGQPTSPTNASETSSTTITVPTSVVGGEPGRENQDDQSPPTSGGDMGPG